MQKKWQVNRLEPGGPRTPSKPRSPLSPLSPRWPRGPFSPDANGISREKSHRITLLTSLQVKDFNVTYSAVSDQLYKQVGIDVKQ